MIFRVNKFHSFVLSIAICFLSSAGWALQPNEILVIANRNAAKSVGLAKYYMKKRAIPESNLLQLWVTDKERCSRDDYNRKIAKKVRKHLRENDTERRIRCLLVMYGMPLKVAPKEMNAAEKKQVQSLRKEQIKLRKILNSIGDKDQERSEALQKDLQAVKEKITTLTKKNERSSLDSELALVLNEDYSLDSWIPNPLFVGFKNKKMQIEPKNVLLVSRLDASSDTLVKKIINDSIAAEIQGLKGKAYFDARWPRPTEKKPEKKGLGYGFYDRSIYAAADRVEHSGLMPVVVDDKQALFQPGDGPDAALYCGWYSLGRYVDAFEWQPGAVGFHIASSECTTLKKSGSQVWCKRMLEEGAAATIGPTSEPYVQAFPVPEIFFAALLDGRLTLAECYGVSKLFWSWQMVLIGDPLYRPFKNANRGK
jgi:uncharacterized protein (TIGR03790 family)